MCFSAQASRLSLMAGLLGSYLVYHLGGPFHHFVACFLAYVSLMQAVEWGLWSHPHCDTWHRYLSILGMLLNSSQPIVLGILALSFSVRAQSHRFWLIGSMLIYFLAVVYFIWDYTIGLQCTQPRKGDPHLVWNWTKLPYFEGLYHVVCILISLLGMPTLMEGVGFISIFAVLLGVSKIYYPREAFGSIWCYFTAFVPIFYYIFYLALHFSKKNS